MLVQELNGTGAVLASYTYDGLDRPVTMWRGGQTYTYLLDRLGSVRGLADAAGNLVASYRYDPWGNLLASTGTIANPLRFTSREYDEESGLYFYRARYYDPVVGRFISRDPLAVSEQSGTYTYVDNAPSAWTDPFGLYKYSKTAGGKVNNATSNALSCFEKCSGQRIIVTAARETKKHMKGSAHGTGQACDIGKNSNPNLKRKEAERCFNRCFPKNSYGQEEGNHYHFQTRPGKYGSKGFALEHGLRQRMLSNERSLSR